MRAKTLNLRSSPRLAPTYARNPGVGLYCVHYKLSLAVMRRRHRRRDESVCKAPSHQWDLGLGPDFLVEDREQSLVGIGGIFAKCPIS